jgi:hypothetical protein
MSIIIKHAIILVTENSREAAKVLIDKLKIEEGYNPMKYENPCEYIYIYINFIYTMMLYLTIFLYRSSKSSKYDSSHCA